MKARHDLHLTMPNGRIAIIDLTDVIQRTYYAADDTEGQPVPTSVATALQPQNPTDIDHRIALIVSYDPAAAIGGATPIHVDKEAAALLPAAGWTHTDGTIDACAKERVNQQGGPQ